MFCKRDMLHYDLYLTTNSFSFVTKKFIFRLLDALSRYTKVITDNQRIVTGSVNNVNELCTLFTIIDSKNKYIIFRHSLDKNTWTSFFGTDLWLHTLIFPNFQLLSSWTQFPETCMSKNLQLRVKSILNCHVPDYLTLVRLPLWS